jgi:hypothetical protein
MNIYHQLGTQREHMSSTASDPRQEGAAGGLLRWLPGSVDSERLILQSTRSFFFLLVLVVFIIYPHPVSESEKEFLEGHCPILVPVHLLCIPPNEVNISGEIYKQVITMTGPE